MKITSINLLEPKDQSNKELLKVVDIVFDESIKLKDIKLLKSARGFYIEFPKSHYSGYEVFHCCSREMRNYIFKSIVDAFVRQ